MHNLCRTLEQRWSFQQAMVMCFVDFVSVFDSVLQGLPMADNGGGWNASQTLEADQGVRLVNQNEDYGNWE